MKKISVIFTILACTAVSAVSAMLAHSNDSRSIPNVKITNAPPVTTTYHTIGYVTQQTASASAKTSSAEASAPTTEITKTTAVVTDTYTEELYIDINTADLETLCLLDGIGEATAQAIIDYREENGGFRNIEEIMNVYRIGEKTFDKIRGNIYVNDPYYPDDPPAPDHDEPIDDDYIPYMEDPQDTEPQAVQTEAPMTLDDVAPIELNSADKELLMYLPYVDENIADIIIDLRESLHGFRYEYEIAYIEELSDEQITEILQYIYVAE